MLTVVLKMEIYDQNSTATYIIHLATSK